MALIVDTAQLAQDGKATGDSPLNVRPHAEVSINENTKVTHRLGWNDVMRHEAADSVNLSSFSFKQQVPDNAIYNVYYIKELKTPHRSHINMHRAVSLRQLSFLSSMCHTHTATSGFSPNLMR